MLLGAYDMEQFGTLSLRPYSGRAPLVDGDEAREAPGFRSAAFALSRFQVVLPELTTAGIDCTFAI